MRKIILLTIFLSFYAQVRSQNWYFIHQDVNMSYGGTVAGGDLVYEVANGNDSYFFHYGGPLVDRSQINFSSFSDISSIELRFGRGGINNGFCTTSESRIVPVGDICSPLAAHTENYNDQCTTLNAGVAFVKLGSFKTNTPSVAPSPICEPQSVDFFDETTYCSLGKIKYAVEYSLSANGPFTELLGFGEHDTRYSFTPSDITGLDPGEQVYIKVRKAELQSQNANDYVGDGPFIYDILGCSIELRDNDPIQTTDATCNGENDGTVTLNFKEDVESGYEMRYFVFQGEPSEFSGDLKEEEMPPQAFGEVRFGAGNEGPLMANGDGTFRGTYSLLEGINTNPNPSPGEENQQNYYIIYQEVQYNGLDVTVKSGEILENSFTIRQPTEISISVPTGNVTQPQCSNISGEVTVIGAGGGFPPNPNSTLQYGLEELPIADPNNPNITWQTDSTFSNLEPGKSYRFYAGSSSDCPSDSSEVIAINGIVPPLALSDPEPFPASSPISSDGGFRIVYQGGTSGHSFVLLDENDNTIPSTNYQENVFPSYVEFSGLGTGTYKVTVTDNQPCRTTSDDVIIGVIQNPSIDSVTSTPISCNGSNNGTISVIVTGGDAPYRYRLVRNGVVPANWNTTQPEPNAPPIEVTSLAPGTYVLQIISAGVAISNTPSGAISSTVEIELTNPESVTFTPAPENVSCFGRADGEIRITASGGSNYQYSTILNPTENDWQSLTNNSITDLSAGSYNVLLRNENGCESNPILGVIVDKPNELVVSEIVSNHQNVSTNGGNDGSIEVNVTGGTPFTDQVPAYYNYEWTGPNGVIANSNSNILSGIGEGTYSVEVSDANTCSVNSVDIVITEPGPLSIQPLTGTDTCNGQDNGTITASVQGTGDITFEFLLAPGPGETVTYSLTTPNRTATAPDLAAGTYGLRITEVTSGNSITTPVVDYITINKLAPISATVTPTDLSCNEVNTGIITITGASGGSNFGFEYAIDDGFGFQTNNTFTGLAPREYTVTVRDNLGCEFNTTVDVIQSGAPVIDNINTVVTNASSATNLDGSIILEFDTDPTNYTYVWTGPGVTGRTTKDLDLIGGGTYQVIVTAPGNCTLTRDFTVGVQSAFSIQSFTGTPTCFNQSNGSLTATIVATGDITFNWGLLRK